MSVQQDSRSSAAFLGQDSYAVGVVIRTAVLTLLLMVIAGCDPPYFSETYATSTPKPHTFNTSELATAPVALFAFTASGNLQGFGPTLSHALSGALTEVNPPIRYVETDDVLNRLSDHELTAEYAEMRTGFARTGVLDRHRLQRIGAGLGAQYALLPGVAQFKEEILDKYEAAGIKLLRNRVTTLRIWLQLWDTHSGHIVWESSGAITAATVFLSPKQTITLEQIAKKLLVRMIQDELLGSKTETQGVEDH